MVASERLAATQARADLCGNDPHIGPPGFIDVAPRRERSLDEQRDGASQIRQADDLRDEMCRFVALVVIVDVR